MTIAMVLESPLPGLGRGYLSGSRSLSDPKDPEINVYSDGTIRKSWTAPWKPKY